MNKHELKQFAAIVPHLTAIQNFVDQHIVGGNTMTAAEVATQFIKETGCPLTQQTFINTFRLAIREGRITGIEGAQRNGYRRIGAKVITAADAAIAHFAEHVAHAQRLVDQHIQGENKMTAAGIFGLFLEDWLGVNTEQTEYPEEQKNLWINGFRSAIRDGKITGIENAGKFGYKRSGYVPVKHEPVAVECESDWSMICSKLHIPITSTGKAVLDAIQSLIDAAGATE